MDKTQAIEAVISAAGDEPIIFTTGYSCRIAQAVRDDDNHFYMTGSMGLAANIGAGLSLAAPRPVVVVDGDGSLAMNPGCLLVAGAMPGLRLVHVVLDDGMYASTGGQPSPTGRLDFCSLALSAGYTEAEEIAAADVLAKYVAGRLQQASGPVLAHCPIASGGTTGVPPRIGVDLAGHAERFAGYVRRTAVASPAKITARTG